MTNSSAVPPLSEAEINRLLDDVRQAGEIAMGHFRHVDHQLKPDRTFLTQADLEIEQFLTDRLQRAYPDYQIIGEEGIASGQPSAPFIWVIDPIDGTTVFAQGLTGWGITLGLLHQGQPCFGLFYMPLINDLTYTGVDGLLYRNDEAVTAPLRQNWEDKGFLATSSDVHHDFQIGLKRTRPLGSISANLVYTARGVATATFSPRASLWDLVAGAAILQNRGGQLRYLSGATPDYLALLDGRLIPEPVIAGHPQVLDGLPKKIRPQQDKDSQKQ